MHASRRANSIFVTIEIWIYFVCLSHSYLAYLFLLLLLFQILLFLLLFSCLFFDNISYLPRLYNAHFMLNSWCFTRSVCIWILLLWCRSFFLFTVFTFLHFNDNKRERKKTMTNNKVIEIQRNVIRYYFPLLLLLLCACVYSQRVSEFGCAHYGTLLCSFSYLLAFSWCVLFQFLFMAMFFMLLQHFRQHHQQWWLISVECRYNDTLLI